VSDKRAWDKMPPSELGLGCVLSISTGFPYCWRRTGFRFLCLRFGWTMAADDQTALDATYARQGKAMRC
jgi:hypothetical protein